MIYTWKSFSLLLVLLNSRAQTSTTIEKFYSFGKKFTARKVAPFILFFNFFLFLKFLILGEPSLEVILGCGSARGDSINCQCDTYLFEGCSKKYHLRE